MPDVALSAMPSPLAALLSGGTADSASTNAIASQGSDPFAALLASATVTKMADTSGRAASPDPVAILLASAAPAAIDAPVARALPVAAQAIAVAAPALPVETSPASVAVQAKPKAKAEDEGQSTDSDKDDEGDPLADAIASGATAVLAYVPAIAAPVQDTVPVQDAAPVQTPRNIDAPITPKLLKLASLPAVPGLTRAQPHAQSQSLSEAQAGQNIAPQEQTGSDAAQPDAQNQRQAPANDAKPAAQQLSPDVAKSVVAALDQSGPNPIVDSQPDAASTPAATESAKPQPQPQQAPQAALRPQREAAPVPPSQARRRNEETPAPRRAGDTRRRTEIAPTDTASASLPQRAPDATQPTIARAVTDVHGKGDTIVEQTLTIARDGAWLDKLAHDIVQAGSGNDLHFKLQPQNLGALSVAIRQSDEGASIRLTADTQTTRDILVDAQPKLVAEARAQGLKVADTQIDVRQDQNNSQNQGSNQDAQRWAQHQTSQNGTSHNGQNRQSSPGHQPFVSNLARKADADSESPDRDSDARYA